jgi:hypothetical protein
MPAVDWRRCILTDVPCIGAAGLSLRGNQQPLRSTLFTETRRCERVRNVLSHDSLQMLCNVHTRAARESRRCKVTHSAIRMLPRGIPHLPIRLLTSHSFHTRGICPQTQTYGVRIFDSPRRAQSASKFLDFVATFDQQTNDRV